MKTVNYNRQGKRVKTETKPLVAIAGFSIGYAQALLVAAAITTLAYLLGHM